MSDILTSALEAFSLFVFAYFILFAVGNMFLIITAGIRLYFDTRHVEYGDLLRAGTSPVTPGVSIVIAAYNEEAGIVDTVWSLLALDYPRRELIVVDDGSADGTFTRLAETFELVEVPLGGTAPIPCNPVTGMYISRRSPELTVLRKENGGRSDALNAGIGVAQMPLVFVTDADGVIESTALLHAVQPFIDDPYGCVAAGGQVRIANGSRFEGGQVAEARVSNNPVAAIQTLEYVRGFLGGRTAWAELNGLIITSGAFGLFRTDAVLEVGGFATHSLGEDFELTMHLRQQLCDDVPGLRVAHVNDAVCWTEAPATLRDLRTQRRRWHVGLMETLWAYRNMTFRRRYGVAGTLAVPFQWAFELIGPVIEVLGYVMIIGAWLLGVLAPANVIALFVVAVLLGITLSIANVLLEEVAYGRYPRARDVVKLMGWALLENFGYRQVTAIWRVQMMVERLMGRRPGWGTIQRAGVASDVPARDVPDDQAA